MDINNMLNKMLGGKKKGTVSQPCPGSKIKSKGLGRGLGTGKGAGPIAGRRTRNDWDGDGVSNRKDCQPRNPMRQDKTPYYVVVPPESSSSVGGSDESNIHNVGYGSKTEIIKKIQGRKVGNILGFEAYYTNMYGGGREVILTKQPEKVIESIKRFLKKK